MKTKIIYISGSEVFEMADVRAALDEVRQTLGLTSDTILFGVPVDKDDAIDRPVHAENTTTLATDTAPLEITSTATDINESESNEAVPEIRLVQPTTVPTDNIENTDLTPIKKSRGRPRKEVKEAASAEVATKPEQITPAPVDAAPEKVIPILSVLASNVTTPAPVDASIDSPVDDVVQIAPAEIESTAPQTETTDAPEMETGAIENMIADDVPESEMEKTLEQLLESMTPLREDHNGFDAAVSVDIEDVAPMVPLDDADATLEQLATEFADNEDTIRPAKIAPAQGKIGKLKNILPFKKVRREDTGIMGDLFGWAGVAANDDDFSMPGFFSTAAKK